MQAGAGVQLHAKPGAQLRSGQPLFTLHTDDPFRFEAALRALAESFDIAQLGTPLLNPPLVINRVA